MKPKMRQWIEQPILLTDRPKQYNLVKLVKDFAYLPPVNFVKMHSMVTEKISKA